MKTKHTMAAILRRLQYFTIDRDKTKVATCFYHTRFDNELSFLSGDCNLLN